MNIKKTIGISNDFWNVTAASGMAGIVAGNLGAGRYTTRADGHEFLNMSSYSYLGLDSHPALIRAAADAVTENASLNTSVSRMRVHFGILRDAEDALSDLFRVEAVTLASCAAAAWSALPLVASGAFTGDVPPLMVFDKHAHFCLNAMKPSVADEAEVRTIAHNDLDALEELCRTHPNVAYVADWGCTAPAAAAPVRELLRLQEKYGLFLFFDEAPRSVHLPRDQGRGLVLDTMGEINDRTLIITSLNKGFGASGGAIFLGPRGSRHRRDLALRYGGPLTWSQRINTAGLGAITASAETAPFARAEGNSSCGCSRTSTVSTRWCPPRRAATDCPSGSSTSARRRRRSASGRALLSEGYYTSALFSRSSPAGKAGLRIMLRADMTRDGHRALRPPGQ
ncbi:aminotransferase class I/II-fold pyridoxal phosphate-dependent enzyme [Streptomyces echinatus]|uniref:aminotransferase class I/II-fold pyridoxal phosphate-dependent enzyme n=1 Tax=Streptomyces echinatus TaxID=67293 RepID=UPI0031EE87F6